MKRPSLLDIVIIFSVFVLLFLAVAFIKLTVFGGDDYDGKIVIKTKSLECDFAECISLGDKVFDCATARQVGVIEKVISERTADGVSLTLTIDAVRRLRYTRAVRTSLVFIEIDGECVYE